MLYWRCEGKEWEKCERRSPTDIKVSGEGEGGGGGAGVEVPLQPMEKTMAKQVVALQPMEDHTEEDIHIVGHEGPTSQQEDTP